MPAFPSLNILDNAPKAIDPICGMTVDPKTALFAERDGKRVYFCSESCRRKFVAPVRQCADDVSLATTLHFCPMCPGMEQMGPGTCRKCGMALDSATGGDKQQSHTEDNQRIALAVGLCVPLLVLSMGGMLGLPGVRQIAPAASGLAQFLLTTVVLFGPGRFALQQAVASVRNGAMNMFTLIGLGIVAAYGSSVWMLFQIMWSEMNLDAHLHVHSHTVMSIPHWNFEAAAVIATLVIIGQRLEAAARQRTTGVLAELQHAAPAYATVIENDKPTTVLAELLQPGQVVRVLPGDRIPADGAIIVGRTDVDESLLTGETAGVGKGPADPVLTSTINLTGPIDVRVTAAGATSVHGQIIDNVSSAQRGRVPIQRLADRVSAVFVPIVISVAVVTGMVWWSVGGPDRVSRVIQTVTSVLVIACPCAIGLAAPMAIVVGVGAASRRGLVVHEPRVFEDLARMTSLVVDKTGTLTLGRPVLVAVDCLPLATADHVLETAAALEQHSRHPMAVALTSAVVARRATGEMIPQANSLEFSREENLKREEKTRNSHEFHYEEVSTGACRGERLALAATEVVTVPGEGIRGMVETETACVGSLRFVLAQTGLAETNLPDLYDIGDEESAAWVGSGRRILGRIRFRDEIRPDAKVAIAEIQSQGISVVMATGDRLAVARVVANAVGIADIHAGLSPADKAGLVSRLQGQGEVVAMFGDGLNDTPALATADVAIGVGTGTAAAMAGSQLVILGRPLDGLVTAVQLSHDVIANIRQNLWLAFGYNLLCIPVAAGVLYPLTGMFLSPMAAAGAMTFSSLSVIGNAVRLQNQLRRPRRAAPPPSQQPPPKPSLPPHA